MKLVSLVDFEILAVALIQHRDYGCKNNAL